MGRRRSPKQSKIMLEFMQKHQDIAIGSINRENRESYEHLWTTLTEKLNANGPPIRKKNEWKKGWRDWKKCCRRKLEQPGDGGCTSITEQERIIIDMCGFMSTNQDECESDEISVGSTTSSDTPLKLKADEHESAMSSNDPLKEEIWDAEEAPTADMLLTNTQNISEQNRRRQRSVEQSNILLNFMNTHKELAAGYQKDKKQAELLWKQLTKELNDWGPPYKNTIAWKKAWTDWKTSCRKKNGMNLTAQEHNILQLCDFKQADNSECNSLDEATNDSSNLTNMEHKTGVCKKRKLKEEDEIDEQADAQIFLTEHLLETSAKDSAPTISSPSPSPNTTRTLADIKSGVVNIQNSLQELCSLIAEQNQELKRFFTESRRHHFVVEKEIYDKKQTLEK